MAPGELYWMLVEQHWDRVSIYKEEKFSLGTSRAGRVEVRARAETGSVGAR
jgi:hypothetical protein